MEKPRIRTAIPKRRYRVGQYSVVILGEVESEDSVDYEYILATVVEGEAEPGLYVVAERRRTHDREEGSHVLTVVMRDGSQVIGVSDRWAELASFTSDALDIVVRILNLQDEDVRRLL